MLPKAVRDLTQELTRLPGIGPKTAQRLSIHLLRQPAAVVNKFAQTLQNLHTSVHLCQQCFNLSEGSLCNICQDAMRDRTVLCVVEEPLDVEAIEKTHTFNGRYHVLGGVLSPVSGIGTDDLTLKQLFDRISQQQIKEVIIALDHTMESEATTRHIMNQLHGIPVTISRLARGLPTGGDIEFADALTLSAAFSGRRPLS